MSDEKKWKPVHEICVKELSGTVVPALNLLHWADIYSAGAVAPTKDIPRIIKVLGEAKAKLSQGIEAIDVISRVESAIKTLEQQLKEQQDKIE